jgi:hypothetical protein
MRLFAAFGFAAALLGSAGPALAWGDLGHKVTALIAYRHLTPKRAARHLLAKQRQGRTNDEPLEARWGVATRSIVDAVTQIGR